MNERDCPICEGKNTLKSVVSWHTYLNGDVEASLPLRYSVCLACSCEVADGDETRENKLAVLQFRES